MATDPHHQLRQALDQHLARLADDLPALAPQLGGAGSASSASRSRAPECASGGGPALWLDHLKGQLQAQIDDRDLTAARPAGRRPGRPGPPAPHMPTRPRRRRRAWPMRCAFAAQRFDGEIADLVSGTIARWDAAETSRRLELLLGPDLQYIRINGTVVGAMAGLALHAIVLAPASMAPRGQTPGVASARPEATASASAA